MTDRFVLDTTVTYGDVDRHERMLLGRLFKMLQEVAILNANQFELGTNAVTARGESWVLHRIAVTIERYPVAREQLRVETWSAGIKGFKGYREFRVFDGNEQLVITGSSLWLYISVKTGAITRVPKDVAANFPMRSDPMAFADMESTELPNPGANAQRLTCSLRYGDYDVNNHVNNAAYFDIVQTALAAAGSAHPRRVQVKFARAIPVGAERVDVRAERNGADVVRFAVEDSAGVYAVGVAG